MAEEIPDMITHDAENADAVNNENDEELSSLISMAFGDEEGVIKRYIEEANRRLGINALEHPDKYDRDNIIEVAIHVMRWEPHNLFTCNPEQLHDYEMAIAAHVVFLKNKENTWRVVCEGMREKLRRAIKLAASRMDAKSVGEREAMVLAKCPEIRDKICQFEKYRIYSELCHGMPDVFTQMDNSLKKTIERRLREQQ